jgi:NADPH:quinone reductase
VRAAWYERQGPAEDVLHVGDRPDPVPGPDEVRIRVRVSGVSTGDVKKRAKWLGAAMPHPFVIPHSDGAGEIDAVGEGVDPGRVGERVWCYGAQSRRPFGTAAELVVVSERQAVRLPDAVSFGYGACLGAPGLTAHRALFADGPVEGKTVLVAGAAGAVGSIATQLAAWGGATVLGTVRTPEDVRRARRAGAEHVFVLGEPGVASAILEVAPHGVDRIVEVAFGANLELDTKVLGQQGVIAAYSSPDTDPSVPFWPLASLNATLRLLGSDDFPEAARDQAVADLVKCLEEGRLEVEIGAWFPLEQIAAAHLAVERPSGPGRVVVLLD